MPKEEFSFEFSIDFASVVTVSQYLTTSFMPERMQKCILQVCCPQKGVLCTIFPGEEEPECANQKDEIEYVSVDDTIENFNVYYFNNFTCESVPGTLVEDRPPYEFDFEGTECKPLGECTNEGVLSITSIGKKDEAMES